MAKNRTSQEIENTLPEKCQGCPHRQNCKPETHNATCSTFLFTKRFWETDEEEVAGAIKAACN